MKFQAFLPYPLLLLAAALPSCATAQPASGLTNLAEKPAKARFELTDPVWPAKAGEATIALWKDDKIAAFSMTVDDNMAPDVDWWLEQSKKYGFPVTWFLITGRIEDKPSFWGTWDQWRKVREQGHALDSHTVTHLHIDEPGWKSIEWEYADSLDHLKKNIPGKEFATLAYPGGKNSKVNDRTVAAKYYLAARGTGGTLNPANRIDYFNINGSGSLHAGKPTGPWGDLRNLLDKSLYRGMYYRGWGVYLSHKADPAYMQPIFEFLDKNRKDLWMGLFTDVAKYGQERDTATLTVTENTPQRIALSLKDQMDDARFDYPLTLKVRLPEAWTGAKASQNGKVANTATVQHEGARFALVDVVPDRGPVTLTPQ